MHVGEPGEIISPGFSQSVLPLHDAGQKATDPKHALEETGAFFSVADADLSPDLFESVLQSDIGVSTLLTRLKQSVASARDFAIFLKKRSLLEEELAQGLKKLCRSSHEAARRSDGRQGSYARSYEDLSRIHDRMADNGIQFALSLHQMHDDLQDLAIEKERGRKQWKQSGLNAERRVQDLEAAAEKAKLKSSSLSDEYDRARTGDKQPGRFGLKGPKSAAQVEEDLHRKFQAAESDYATKIQVAQNMRRDLVTIIRPQALQALQHLINECDCGLDLQMQKFASFSEKLLLSYGLCICPLQGQANVSGSSLRQVVRQINIDQDMRDFVISFANKVGPKQIGSRSEVNRSQQPVQPNLAPTGFRQAPHTSATQQLSLSSMPGNQKSSPGMDNPSGPNEPPLPYQVTVPVENSPGSPNLGNFPIPSIGATRQSPVNSDSQLSYNQLPLQMSVSQTALSGVDPPPLRPVFGQSLEYLFNRDGSAVPIVVYQCLQAVDLFGLEVEGIYRLSGTASHISKLRSIFDNDASRVDFTNPENFFHDMNSVAGLLKQFLRDLPDPLLTREHYPGFIEAARIDDDTMRRDSLHASINNLPDPNYATLRALTLHLHRVQEHSNVNRMNSGNLAICFGPTIMGSNSSPNIADAGWQVRVIDTILQNTYQIFDDD